VPKSARNKVAIGVGAFHAGVNDVAKLLKSLDLLDYHEPRPNYDATVVQRARTATSYAAEWEVYDTSSSYDVRLADNSLLRFLRQPEDQTVLSYSYNECPYDVLDYESFIVRAMGVSDPDREMQAEYHQYVTTSPLKNHVVPMRYDWSPELYRCGVHPSGHLHVGRENDVRIGCAHILEPIGFLYFVLRQRYPTAWSKLLKRNPKPSTQTARGEKVPSRMYRGDDLIELYLK
jgi:hypothetical protein